VCPIEICALTFTQSSTCWSALGCLHVVSPRVCAHYQNCNICNFWYSELEDLKEVP
jgi:hypothetical protein